MRGCQTASACTTDATPTVCSTSPPMYAWWPERVHGIVRHARARSSSPVSASSTARSPGSATSSARWSTKPNSSSGSRWLRGSRSSASASSPAARRWLMITLRRPSRSVTRPLTRTRSPSANCSPNQSASSKTMAGTAPVASASVSARNGLPWRDRRRSLRRTANTPSRGAPASSDPIAVTGPAPGR